MELAVESLLREIADQAQQADQSRSLSAELIKQIKKVKIRNFEFQYFFEQH